MTSFIIKNANRVKDKIETLCDDVKDSEMIHEKPKGKFLGLFESNSNSDDLLDTKNLVILSTIKKGAQKHLNNLTKKWDSHYLVLKPTELHIYKSQIVILKTNL